VHFAVPAADPRFHALVVAFDDRDAPMAQTWRAVGRAARELGLPRPGYHMVRLLAKSVRVRETSVATRRAALEVLTSIPSPYVAHLRSALGQLLAVRTHERLVLEQHKPP
jgi:hypothetical protein